MSVAGSFRIQSPGLQSFMSFASCSLIWNAWTSAGIAGLLKRPNRLRVGVRSQFFESRTRATYAARDTATVVIPNTAMSRRSRVSSTFTTASPRVAAASWSGVSTMLSRMKRTIAAGGSGV